MLFFICRLISPGLYKFGHDSIQSKDLFQGIVEDFIVKYPNVNVTSLYDQEEVVIVFVFFYEVY
jgi:hypothetical protein